MEQLYKEGAPNPAMAGRSIHARVGDGSSREVIERAAAALNVPVTAIDSDGYECEIVGAAMGENNGHIAYVYSRAKEIAPDHVDVSFTIHLRAADGSDTSWEIESYNPYFGCDVRYFEWINGSAVLIYREKHTTYACRIQPGVAAHFEKIQDYWTISSNALGYCEWRAKLVQCLSLPELTKGESMSPVEAEKRGILPPMPWIELDRRRPPQTVQSKPPCPKETWLTRVLRFFRR